MIIELLLSVIGALLSGLDAIIPDVPVPFEDELSDFAAFVGGNLGGLNTFLPITEIGVALVWALTVYLPFVVSFCVVRWIFAHVPYVGGGGA